MAMLNRARSRLLSANFAGPGWTRRVWAAVSVSGQRFGHCSKARMRGEGREADGLPGQKIIGPDM